MKVVVLSDHASEGGAAQATLRIAMAIQMERTRRIGAADLHRCHDLADFRTLSAPIERIVYFEDGLQLDPFVDQPSVLWYEESALKRQIQRVPRKLLPGLFPHPNTPDFAAHRLRKKLRQSRPDVINVHNLHAAAPWGWGPHLIEVCLQFAPVVWTLHDMWSFTGRCAYSYDCEKFLSGCDASCPTPHENPKLAPEKIGAAWEERQTIYARHRDDLAIVSPSRWLADKARHGMFAQHRVEVIPNPLASAAFVPTPRDEARRQLGVTSAGPVLLLVAHDLTERRKGAEILPHVWPNIQHRPLTVLTMGRGTLAVDDPTIKVHPLGWIDSDATKALAYSAADALLHPAPVDNLPNVVAEAFACGTPAIAMPVGGLPEMILPGISGWLADAATPVALGQAVDAAIGDLALDRNLRESCRALAQKEYAMESAGRRYCDLFEALLRR